MIRGAEVGGTVYGACPYDCPRCLARLYLRSRPRAPRCPVAWPRDVTRPHPPGAPFPVALAGYRAADHAYRGADDAWARCGTPRLASGEPRRTRQNLHAYPVHRCATAPAGRVRPGASAFAGGYSF